MSWKSDLKVIITDKSHLIQLLPYSPECCGSIPSMVEKFHINPLAGITNKIHEPQCTVYIVTLFIYITL